MKYFMGLDLGQASDYTALGVWEKFPRVRQAAPEPIRGDPSTYRPPEPMELPAHYQCRALERFQLGTPYPEIVATVKGHLMSPVLRGKTTLVVDATGVGRPVVDSLREQGLHPVAVTITSGNTVTRAGAYWNVPKRDLVGVLQVMFQSKRLQFAEAMPLVPTLIEELLNFKVKITAAANDTYGAWRDGQHDDLVLALAVAAWYAERHVEPRNPGTYSYGGYEHSVPIR